MTRRKKKKEKKILGDFKRKIAAVSLPSEILKHKK